MVSTIRRTFTIYVKKYLHIHMYKYIIYIIIIEKKKTDIVRGAPNR